ncbi:MAG: hypothetical protein WA840_24325 [Caulobacteraceae bacterium]
MAAGVALRRRNERRGTAVLSFRRRVWRASSNENRLMKASEQLDVFDFLLMKESAARFAAFECGCVMKYIAPIGRLRQIGVAMTVCRAMRNVQC